MVKRTALLLLVAAQLAGAARAASINTSSNQVGRLTSMGNGEVRRFLEYDAQGRPVRSEHVLDGTSYVFASTYGYPVNPGTTPGPGTVMRSSTYPDGEVVSYGFDAAGMQQSVTATRPGQSAQPIISGWLRNARGQTVRTAFGNGAVTDRFYDESTDLRLDQVVSAFGTSPFQDYRYTFDSNGNVVSLQDLRAPAFSDTYCYDSLDQLAGRGGCTLSFERYRYDRLGNLIDKEGVTQAYGGTGRGPHALAGSGSTLYTYDSNGNVTGASDGLALTWNSENMATRASISGLEKNRKSFLGDSLWKKIEGGTTTYYLPGLLIENGQARKFYGSFAERSPDGSLKFYHPDHLGSSTVVTDLLQNVVHRIGYLPFGEDRGTPAGGFLPRFQFNFKERDSTGLYDYGARLYNPATGRWMSADLLTVDGPNRYTYVSNNPLRYVDPTGRFQEPTEPNRNAAMVVVISPRDRGGDGSATVWLHDERGLFVNAGPRNGQFDGLGVGGGANRTRTNADTPFGVYRIKYEETRADNGFGVQGGTMGSEPRGPAYGTGIVYLEPVRIEGRGRTVIYLHGGRDRTGQPLVRTQGCVRCRNSDINIIIGAAKGQIYKGNPFYYVFMGDAAYLNRLAEEKDSNGVYRWRALRLALGMEQPGSKPLALPAQPDRLPRQ